MKAVDAGDRRISVRPANSRGERSIAPFSAPPLGPTIPDLAVSSII